MSASGETFRTRLAAGDLLVGSFVKTPVPHMVEIAALCALDFVLLDAEHAPFTVRDLDLAILAGRAARIDVAVRIPAAEPGWAQQSLDLGAAAIVVPHVASAAAAAAMVAAARFAGGKRGFSTSPRAGAYGTATMAGHLRDSDQNAAVIVQIESPAAVDAVDDIAGVPGVDALFIGRADLTVAFGANDRAASHVDDAVERITAAARARKMAVASFYADVQARSAEKSNAASMIVLGSDQSMLRSAWNAASKAVRS